MVRKRQNKIQNLFKLHKKLKKERNEEYCFKTLRHHIIHDHDNYLSEENLINMLKDVSSEVLQMADEDGNLLLYHAIRNAFDSLAIKMWELYPNAVKDQKLWLDRNPLQIAIKKGRLDIVRILLDGELHNEYKLSNMKDCRGRTALFYACFYNYDALVKRLCIMSSRIINHQDVNGMTAFHICCEQKAYKCIKIFLNDESANLLLRDQNGNTPFILFYAAISKDIVHTPDVFDEHILALFIQKCKTISNNDDNRCFNILHAHAKYRYKNYNAFDYLIDNGLADSIINQQDEFGNTPLHYATKIPLWYHQHTTLRKIMNHPGVLIDMKNDIGRTPFHLACYFLRTFMISDIIKRPGVNLDRIDNNGENALHHMIQGFIKNNGIDKTDFINNLNLLLKANPFLVNYTNNINESAYDYAITMQKAFDSNQKDFILNGRTIILTNCFYFLPTKTKTFWPSVIHTLQYYQSEARYCKFKALMQMH